MVWMRHVWFLLRTCVCVCACMHVCVCAARCSRQGQARTQVQVKKRSQQGRARTWCWPGSPLAAARFFRCPLHIVACPWWPKSRGHKARAAHCTLALMYNTTMTQAYIYI